MKEKEKTIVFARLRVHAQWYQSPNCDPISYKLQSENLEDVASRPGSHGASWCYVLTLRVLWEFALARDKTHQLSRCLRRHSTEKT